MASSYSQIHSNQTKTWFLITAFVLITVGFFYALGIYFRNPVFTLIGLALGIGQPLIGYFFGDKIALRMAQAEKIEYDANPQLHEMVENLARVAGIEKPAIYISPDQSPNAFATGRDPHNASVCFNQGILDILDKNELEGVTAHELAHIKNRDILIMTIAAILASVVGILADLVGRLALFGGGNDNGDSKSPFGIVVFIVAIFLTPFLAFMLQMAISRNREYLADATAVSFTRFPQGLKKALLKLHNNPLPAETAHSFTNHLYISEPKMEFGGTASWFSTHPPIEERVAKLDEMG